MAQVTITRLETPGALHCHYPRQTRPQPCYVELDCRDGSLGASYDAQIGNAVPMAVYHGHVRRYPVPCLTAEAANPLMARIAPLAERVVAGYARTWDGSNHVARLSEDAQDAEQEIMDAIEAETVYSDQLVQYSEAGDWLYDVRDNLVARLAAGETVQALEAELDGDGSDTDTPILGGLPEYLACLAEDARESVS